MTDSLWRYDGKRIVVTGCASGMGEATAVTARERGAHVIGIDVRTPTAQVDQFIRMDLGDKGSIDGAVSEIGEPIDGLFNIAALSNGAGPAWPIFRIAFLGTRYFTERMRPKIADGGAIVNVATLGARNYPQNMPDLLEMLDIAPDDWTLAEKWVDEHPHYFEGGGYNFGKQCLIAYTMRRAVQWAPAIRSNVIGPAPTETPLLADAVKAYGTAYLDNFPRPLGRNATAQEQANVMLFLNSEAASYLNGLAVWTDGGYMAGLATGLITEQARPKSAK